MHLRELVPPRIFSVATAFATKGGAAALQFLQSVVLGRLLGVEALGIYFFAVSVYRIAESAAPCGVTLSTVREVGAARATGSWSTIRTLARRSAFFCLGAGLLLSLGVWFGADGWHSYFLGGYQLINALLFLLLGWQVFGPVVK